MTTTQSLLEAEKAKVYQILHDIEFIVQDTKPRNVLEKLKIKKRKGTPQDEAVRKDMLTKLQELEQYINSNLLIEQTVEKVIEMIKSDIKTMIMEDNMNKKELSKLKKEIRGLKESLAEGVVNPTKIKEHCNNIRSAIDQIQNLDKYAKAAIELGQQNLDKMDELE